MELKECENVYYTQVYKVLLNILVFFLVNSVASKMLLNNFVGGLVHICINIFQRYCALSMIFYIINIYIRIHTYNKAV